MSIDTGFEPASSATSAHDLDQPSLYLNRELAWLSYNRRILHEAENDAAPLLERVAFLAAFSANLDDFFMHRVGGLKQQLLAGLSCLSVDGRTPQQQLAACRDHAEVYIADEAFVYFELNYLLAKEGIHILDVGGLNGAQTAALRRHYLNHIRPLLTPMAIDTTRPFPTIAGLTNNLIVEARDTMSGRDCLIRIELPVRQHMPRLVRLGDDNVFVPVEQIVMANLDDLLPGARIRTTGMFRASNNAIALGDGRKARDLLEAMPAGSQPQPGPRYSRLEVSADLPPQLIELLADGLGLDGDRDVYNVNSLIGARDLGEIARLPVARLRYAPPRSAGHPRLLDKKSIIEEVASHGPVFLQHPYHAYDRTVMPLLREAAADPDVLAIKATVSRETRGSGLLAPLIMAARAGKHVVVVAQTGTRTDRKADEKWSRYLESTGIQVSFGPHGHSPNAKAMLIVRHEQDGSLGRTVHVASGYHDSTRTKPDSDVGLISAEEDLANDATELFNLMTSGLLWGRSFDALLVAPEEMKLGLVQRIQRESRAHRASGSGHIIIKANALSDVEITRALYAAARAGVRIELIIRADCRLRPGVNGLSDNVRVVSVLGRYREHACVYYFHNQGQEEYFIGSADPMTQPLSEHVEVLVPVRGEQRRELAEMLRIQLDRRRGAWQMDANGNYRRESSGSDSDAQTQMLLRAQRAEAGARPG